MKLLPHSGHLKSIGYSLAVLLFCLIGTLRNAAARPLQQTGSTFSTDFNSGVPAEITGGTANESVQGFAGLGSGANVFAGNFLRNANVPSTPTTLTLTNLPPHATVSLAFLLAIIDSWDGNGCGQGPDSFNVMIDGNLIFSEVFENSNCGTQSYVPAAGVELARRQSLGFTPTGLYHGDSAYNMTLDPVFQNIPHTADTLTIEWFASGAVWQSGSDESWAIDNVGVTVADIAITDLTASNDSPTLLGAPTTFNASITAGSNVAYSWDFGDGSPPASGAAQSHSYVAAGNYIATVTASNAAGSVSAQTTVVVTAPNQPPTANAGSDQTVNVNTNVTLNGSGSDPEGGALSYLWTQSSGTPVVLSNANSANASFSAPGAPTVLTFVLTVSDPGGLTTSDSVAYTINQPTLYNWTGFFQPVDNVPTVNIVKAGQAIPVKFSLGGDFGLNIFAAGYPKVQTVACGSSGSSGSDAVEETVTAGNSSLNYDPTTQIYNYVWKTDKSWTGSCRQLIVKLSDGSEHIALFKFNGKTRSADNAAGEEVTSISVFLPLINN